MLTLLCALAAAGPGRGQDLSDGPSALWREPLRSPALDALVRGIRPAADNSPAGKTPRIRLFGMPTGYLSDPLGLNADDDPPATEPASKPASDLDLLALARIQVAVGQDNPFFDYRRTGEPGGVGYYRLHSQVQLLDTGTTSLSVGMQAVTPAGLESGGLSDGPTVLSPTLALFQELGGGTAVHGFVGKHILADPARGSDSLNRSLQYGMAVQCPVPGLNAGADQGVYVFVEALGRYPLEGEPSQRRPSWEVLPGIHWRVADNCWMSIGGSRYSMLTCSWQF
jgi:hypothetical protein